MSTSNAQKIHMIILIYYTFIWFFEHVYMIIFIYKRKFSCKTLTFHPYNYLAFDVCLCNLNTLNFGTHLQMCVCVSLFFLLLFKKQSKTERKIKVTFDTCWYTSLYYYSSTSSWMSVVFFSESKVMLSFVFQLTSSTFF